MNRNELTTISIVIIISVIFSYTATYASHKLIDLVGSIPALVIILITIAMLCGIIIFISPQLDGHYGE